jgi:hypothetical protein
MLKQVWPLRLQHLPPPHHQPQLKQLLPNPLLWPPLLQMLLHRLRLWPQPPFP